MIGLTDHEARRAALTDFQRNLVVTAGAGTGKTSLLVGRLLSALLRQHFEPAQILAMTFTENAASEMRTRVLRMLAAVRPFLAGEEVDPSDAYILEQLGLGPENLSRVDELLGRVDELAISTFHGFCLRFLQEHARRLGLPPVIQVVDGEASGTLFDEVFLEHLRRQVPGAVHEALEHFDPGELHALAEAFLDLPDDSLGKSLDVPPMPGLAEHRAALATLKTRYPEARAAWRSAIGELDRFYAALAGEGPMPETTAILDKPEGTPSAGKTELGAEQRAAEAAFQEHRDRLRPYVKADRVRIPLAIDCIRPVIAEYRSRCAAGGELRFQDLLLLTRYYLCGHPDLRREVGQRLGAILVDEFQDTDPLQYDVVFLLAAEPTAVAGDGDGDGARVSEPMELPLRPGTLFIVGDAKQSIYRFRRADVAAFSRAVDRIVAGDGRRLDLTTNFRSVQAVLDFVNKVCGQSLGACPPFQFGYEPVLPRPGVEAGVAVEVLQVDAAEKLASGEQRAREGRLIVERIRGLVSAGESLGDIAILLRAATDIGWILRPLRDAGLPYVLEGSRRFYQRQEIVLAASLLAAMARPHDPVAVLALLRSAFSAATDADLLAWTEAGHSLDFRNVPEGGSGPVADALRALAGLHRVLTEQRTGQQLVTLLAHPTLRTPEAVGFDGAQRIANLDRLLHKLLLAEPAGLAQAADEVAVATARETEDEESAMFDGDTAALRILTVHKAKGLEFGTVFVPDLARQSRAGGGTEPVRVQRLYDADGEERVTVRISGDVRNFHALQLKGYGAEHAQAEQRRLFYVAATRARRRLVLLCGPAEKSGRLWQDDLEAVEHGCDWQRHEAVPAVFAAVGPGQVAATSGPTLAAVRAHRRLAEELRPRAAAAASPSSLAVDHFAAFDGTAAGADDGGRDGDRPQREAAARLGIATHHYLATVDLLAAAVDEARLARLDAAEQVRPLAAAWHASEKPALLRQARRLHREVPVQFLSPSGSPEQGVVDLVVETGDGGLAVVDWKTTRLGGRDPASVAAPYAAQLRAYGETIRAALGAGALPSLWICFVADAVWVPIAPDEGAQAAVSGVVSPQVGS